MDRVYIYLETKTGKNLKGKYFATVELAIWTALEAGYFMSKPQGTSVMMTNGKDMVYIYSQEVTK